MANLEVLALDTAVPQIRAPGAGDGYSVPRDMTMASGTTLSAQALTAAGNVTLSGGTANGVLYLNASKVATSGSELQFSGTNLSVGAAVTSTTWAKYIGIQATYPGIVFDSVASGGKKWTVGADAGSLLFRNETDSLSAAVIDSSGNLGIGTASPTAKLNVVGTSADYGSPQLTVGDSSSFATGKQLLLGYNTVTSKGFIQSVHWGTGYTDLILQPTAGNLGLGVTPSAWNSGYKALQVQGGLGLSASSNFVYLSNNWFYDAAGVNKYVANGFASVYSLDNAGKHIWYTAPSGTAGNTITFTQAMTLDASGNWQLGTTTAFNTNGFDRHANIRGSSNAVLYVGNTSAAANCIEIGWASTESYVGNISNTPLTLLTNNTERARITSGGYFKASNDGTYKDATGTYHELRTTSGNIGTAYITSNATNGTQYGLGIQTANDQNDATRWFLECVGGATVRAAIYSNGGLSNYSANNVNLASDERLKKDISPLATAWGKVKGMEVVNFRYKDCNEGDPLLYGVIAQQVQPIVPELVVVTREATETDPEYYGIREQPMYWLAIKALQEAMARIEQLEAKVAALEA